MAQYTFAYNNAATRLLKVEVVFDNIHDEIIHVQLPAWRPGRYELGNFAQNIVSFEAVNESGSKLPFKKITKDSPLLIA